MCKVVFQLYTGAEMPAGVATAGIRRSAMAADQLKATLYIICEARTQEHETGNRVEGRVSFSRFGMTWIRSR